MGSILWGDFIVAQIPENRKQKIDFFLKLWYLNEQENTKEGLKCLPVWT